MGNCYSLMRMDQGHNYQFLDELMLGKVDGLSDYPL
jgi:hypothetical protein